MKTEIWPADRVERIPLADLVPYARNARIHTEEQVEEIARSMDAFGWTIPVLRSETNEIIAGHGRVLAAAKRGYREAPVITARGWDDAKIKAYRIADNRLSEKSEWDDDLLRRELTDLRDFGFEVELTGFALKDIQLLLGEVSGLTDPDDAPEPPANPITRQGDVWLLGADVSCPKQGGHRLVCGDSTDPATVALALAGAKPHLMVTDPPHGVNYDPDWRNRSAIGWSQSISTGIVHNDDRSDWSAAYENFHGDVAYVWAPAGPTQFEFYRTLVDTGFITGAGDQVVPAIVAAAGPRASRRFLEFFAVTIENPNTRAAYFHACRRFFAWCEGKGVDELVVIEPMHVAAYIRALGKDFEKPTVKQHLAAIRMLFDWLVVGQVVAINPAHSVRGPKHAVKSSTTAADGRRRETRRSLQGETPAPHSSAGDVA